MTHEETKIFYSLRGAKQRVALLLRELPHTRNMGTDDFLTVFRDRNRGSKHSSETIRRSRQIVQNTLGLFPRDKAPTEWREPIKKVLKEHDAFKKSFQQAFL